MIESIPDRWDKTKVSLLGIMNESLSDSLRLVHRLDKETSGLILFAKDLKSQRSVSRQFETHEIQKYYFAIVDGEVKKSSGKINYPLEEDPKRPGKTRVVKKKGKLSVTHYEVNERFQQFTLLRVSPLSGRTHQVRVHMAEMGHPLAVDPLYGRRSELYLSELKPNYKRKKEGERPLIGRLTLHAGALQFKNLDDREITLEAPLPKDFEITLKYLRKFRPPLRLRRASS